MKEWFDQNTKICTWRKEVNRESFTLSEEKKNKELVKQKLVALAQLSYWDGWNQSQGTIHSSFLLHRLPRGKLVHLCCYTWWAGGGCTPNAKVIGAAPLSSCSGSLPLLWSWKPCQGREIPAQEEEFIAGKSPWSVLCWRSDDTIKVVSSGP